MCSVRVTSQEDNGDVINNNNNNDQNGDEDIQQNDSFCKNPFYSVDKKFLFVTFKHFFFRLFLSDPTCKRIEFTKVYQDPATGCRSRKHVTHRECAGGCADDSAQNRYSSLFDGAKSRRARRQSCCVPKKVKPRRVRVFCADGTSSIVMMPVIRKCGCKQCPADGA